MLRKCVFSEHQFSSGRNDLNNGVNEPLFPCECVSSKLDYYSDICAEIIKKQTLFQTESKKGF